MGKALLPQQQVFADEYLVDLNATQAAIRAGYSPGSARVQSTRLIAHAAVKSYIDEQMTIRAQRTEITQDMVLQELAAIGFSNYMDYVKIADTGETEIDLSTLTRAQAAAISDISVTGEGADREIHIKLYDKRSALVDVGKHLGMFKDGGVNLNLIGIDKIEVVPVEPEVKTIEGKANK